MKTLTDKFGQEASSILVKMAVTAEFDDGLPVDGDQFQTMRDVMDSLGMGKVFINAEPIAGTEEEE